MVNGTGTGNFTMRLVRSKLRKREEHLDTASPINLAEKKETGDTQSGRDDLAETTISSITTDNCNAAMKDHQHVTFVRTSGVGAAAPSSSVVHADVTNLAEWTFPPKAPAPHIYHINPEMLVANDKNGFKGFRKQFSGRFKRLVARKPEPGPVIPPELKPQLKTIYVY